MGGRKLRSSSTADYTSSECLNERLHHTLSFYFAFGRDPGWLVKTKVNSGEFQSEKTRNFEQVFKVYITSTRTKTDHYWKILRHENRHNLNQRFLVDDHSHGSVVKARKIIGSLTFCLESLKSDKTDSDWLGAVESKDNFSENGLYIRLSRKKIFPQSAKPSAEPNRLERSPIG